MAEPLTRKERQDLLSKASGMHFADRGNEPWLSANVVLRLLADLDRLDEIEPHLTALTDAANIYGTAYLRDRREPGGTNSYAVLTTEVVEYDTNSMCADYRRALDALMDWRCGIPGHAVARGCGVSYAVQGFLGMADPVEAERYMVAKYGADRADWPKLPRPPR